MALDLNLNLLTLLNYFIYCKYYLDVKCVPLVSG